MFIHHTGYFSSFFLCIFIEINYDWWGLQPESKHLKIWNFELHFFWTLKPTKNINNIWICTLNSYFFLVLKSQCLLKINRIYFTQLQVKIYSNVLISPFSSTQKSKVSPNNVLRVDQQSWKKYRTFQKYSVESPWKFWPLKMYIFMNHLRK